MMKRTSSQVIDEIAETKLGRDIDLSSSIRESVRRDNSRKMKTKKIIITVTAVILASVILMTIPGVARAIKRIFAYIPNAGIVEKSSPLRVLDEPVQVNDGETTIIVQQGVVDQNATTILYQVDHLFSTGEDDTAQTESTCDQIPQLKLSDGSVLQGKTISGNSWHTGYTRHLEYPALPGTENAVTLIFGCLEGKPLTSDLQPFEIPLKFVQAPADLTVYPIIDLPTPEGATADGNGAEAANGEVSGVSFALQKYVQTDDELILFGSLVTHSDSFRIAYADESAVHLTDAAGAEITLSQDYSVTDPEAAASDGKSLALAYRINGSYKVGQATMTIDDLWITLPAEATFTFDPGENPQPGQKWELNESLQAAGYTLLIKDVTLNDSGDGLMFTLGLPEDVAEVSLTDPDHPQWGGGGGSEATGFTYKDGFPAGPIQVTLTAITARLKGPWKATLDLPETSVNVPSEENTQACLTSASWKSALENTTSLPAEVQGTLLLADPLEPTFYYHVLKADVSGSERIDLGLGKDGSMSPDKSMVIYETDQGLMLLDLGSGQQKPVPGTSKIDHSPLWSPDGKRILFTRGPAAGPSGGMGTSSLVVMNADGSNQQTVLDDSFANRAQAWFSNSENVLYTVAGADGATVRTINLTTGEIQDNFEINYVNASVALSPDQTRAAYVAMLPGEKYAVYTSNLDGSDPKLIANADPIVVTGPYWSPDGQWLIMSVYDTSIDENHPVLALVQAETCRVIPLVALKGHVTSWK